MDVLLLVGALLGFAVLLPLGLCQLEADRAAHVQAALRDLWSMLFIVGGTLHLVRWRVTGETRPGYRGAAALYLGLLTAPTTAIAPTLYTSVSTAALSPLSRSLAGAGAIWLLARAAHMPQVDTTARPLRALAVTATAGWAFIAALLLWSAHHRPLSPGTRGWAVTETAVGLGWLLCAVAARRRAAADRDVSFTWATVAAAVLAVSQALHVAALLGWTSLSLFSTGLNIAAALIVCVNATADLTVLLSEESRRFLALSHAVHETEHQLDADERADSVRRHDARSVLASLRAATLVLDRYDDTLDQTQRAELLRTFGSELERLERMVERRTDAAVDTFRLDELVGAVLGPGREALVASDLPPVRVRGRAAEFATVVETVVASLARRGDAPVNVRIARGSAGIQLLCEVPAGTAPSAHRDTDATSARNLRLQVARRVLREQGGDVVVTDRWDGSTSVALWLRPADAMPVHADVTATETIRAALPAQRDDVIQLPALRPRRVR